VFSRRWVCYGVNAGRCYVIINIIVISLYIILHYISEILFLLLAIAGFFVGLIARPSWPVEHTHGYQQHYEQHDHCHNDCD